MYGHVYGDAGGYERRLDREYGDRDRHTAANIQQSESGADRIATEFGHSAGGADAD
jgi:hypothetical protein